LFAATEGVEVELQLEGVAPDSIRGARVHQEGDVVYAVPEGEPGLGSEVVVGRTTLVFLDRESADAVWKGEIDGRESVLVWRGSAWFDDGFRYLAQDRDGVLDVFPPLRGDGLETTTG